MLLMSSVGSKAQKRKTDPRNPDSTWNRKEIPSTWQQELQLPTAEEIWSLQLTKAPPLLVVLDSSGFTTLQSMSRYFWPVVLSSNCTLESPEEPVNQPMTRTDPCLNKTGIFGGGIVLTVSKASQVCLMQGQMWEPVLYHCPPTGNNFVLQGTPGNVWRHLWLLQLGREYVSCI